MKPRWLSSLRFESLRHAHGFHFRKDFLHLHSQFVHFFNKAKQTEFSTLTRIRFLVLFQFRKEFTNKREFILELKSCILL